jgi:hypothetical protein
MVTIRIVADDGDCRQTVTINRIQHQGKSIQIRVDPSTVQKLTETNLVSSVNLCMIVSQDAPQIEHPTPLRPYSSSIILSSGQLRTDYKKSKRLTTEDKIHMTHKAITETKDKNWPKALSEEPGEKEINAFDRDVQGTNYQVANYQTHIKECSSSEAHITECSSSEDDIIEIISVHESPTFDRVGVDKISGPIDDFQNLTTNSSSDDGEDNRGLNMLTLGSKDSNNNTSSTARPDKLSSVPIILSSDSAVEIKSANFLPERIDSAELTKCAYVLTKQGTFPSTYTPQFKSQYRRGNYRGRRRSGRVRTRAGRHH